MLHYPGPHQRVSISLPTGREAEVAKGKDIDLSADEYGLTADQVRAIEANLLEQGWTDASAASKSSRKNPDDKEG